MNEKITLHQGHCITSQMKAHLLTLFEESLLQKTYKSPADYVRLQLEQKYGDRAAL